MPQFTRRSLLAGSALLAVPQTAAAQSGRERNLLASAWSPDTIAGSLPPRASFHPFPTAADRAPWDALPADARRALVAKGEAHLNQPWETLPATVFLEYKRIGNRSHSDNARNRRRDRVRELVVAECIENKGRFVDEIVNGIWLTCEETFWGSNAHMGAQKAGPGLPDVTEPIVDLFAAETSSLLAWTDYLLSPKLAAVSKLVPERIRVEIDRRILTPCRERDDFSWMGLGIRTRNPNNWNPWICSNWLASALIEEHDQKRRQGAVQKIVRCLDQFLNGYYDDGGCDEGPGYWGRAGASLFDCLDLLHRATGGSLDAFPFPLVREIGRYICRAHICDEWYTNFADASARVYPDGDLVYRYGERVHDEKMMAHGAYSAFARDESGIPADSIGRLLPALFHLPALRKAPRSQALLRDTWLPGIQVMAARREEGSARGLYLAAQGGHNAESHNHNDVGNFLVYADGKPAIIDVGVETYTAKTFSSKRYEIWTMQSAYHNCPTINGFMQSPGREFEATEVSYLANDAAAEFKLNLASAYPKEAGLESWRRTLRLDRAKNEVSVRDDYALRSAPGEITLTLMTPCKVTQQAPGEVALENRARVLFDAAVFQPVVEEVRLEDSRLRSSWGERVYRILLRAANAPARGTWTTRIVQ